MPRPRHRQNISKRPRSFALETTVFSPSLADTRRRAGRRWCFGQGGSVSPAATDDRRDPGKPLARTECSRSLTIRRRGTGVLKIRCTLSGQIARLKWFRWQERIFRANRGRPPVQSGRAAPRTDGILVPMRIYSRADEKKFSWARERIACRREIVR